MTWLAGKKPLSSWGQAPSFSCKEDEGAENRTGLVPTIGSLDVTREMNDDEFDFDLPFEPSNRDIREQNRAMQRRQGELRRAAEAVARELAKLPEVEKVVLFGSVAAPLEKEVPRFREFRRAGIAIDHECKDVDLAVWLSDLDHLRALQKARSRALNELFEAEEIGVAHHQVDVFLIEPGSNRYLGRLCRFGQCPKEKKRECSVTGCGRKPFLRQHEEFVFRPEALAAENAIVLFDRSQENDQGQ
jgi:hypothetical protein